MTSNLWQRELWWEWQGWIYGYVHKFPMDDDTFLYRYSSPAGAD